MKESTVTGDYIYQQIKKLNDEHVEICQGMDELDRDTLPYRLLKKAADEKLKELNEARRAEYDL
jgi:ribonucleotide reductase alpha subunit